MQNIDLFGYQVLIDVNATKTWYTQSKAWDCNCGYCRNFLTLALSKELPTPVIEVLSSLNISPEKATYVCEINANTNAINFFIQSHSFVKLELSKWFSPQDDNPWSIRLQYPFHQMI